MSESREESPDWLRCFQAPTHSAVILLSGSESSPNESPTRNNKFDNEKPSLKEIYESWEKDKDRDTVSSEADESSPLRKNKTSNAKSPKKKQKVERTPGKKKKVGDCLQRDGNEGRGKVTKQGASEKHVEQHAPERSVWTLSSDSESCHDNDPMREDTVHREELSALGTSQYPAKKSEKDAPKLDSTGVFPLTKASKGKSPRKQLKPDDELPREDETLAKKKKLTTFMNRKGYSSEIEVAEEEISDKRTEPHLSSSRLPLVLSEKIHRSKALVECEGESIDLSGDMGSVGRVVISDNASGSQDMFFDLKGTIYKTTIVPSRTFCVVSFGQSEAKIEAIMNDFIQLKPQSNVYEAETMVEGTLDGFSFDSEDEAEKMPKASTCQNDQNEGTVEQSNGKAKGKPEKTSGTARRRGKAAGKKPLKSSKKKTQASKKVKAKK